MIHWFKRERVLCFCALWSSALLYIYINIYNNNSAKYVYNTFYYLLYLRLLANATLAIAGALVHSLITTGLTVAFWVTTETLRHATHPSTATNRSIVCIIIAYFAKIAWCASREARYAVRASLAPDTPPQTMTTMQPWILVKIAFSSLHVPEADGVFRGYLFVFLDCLVVATAKLTLCRRWVVIASLLSHDGQPGDAGQRPQRGWGDFQTHPRIHESSCWVCISWT